MRTRIRKRFVFALLLAVGWWAWARRPFVPPDEAGRMAASEVASAPETLRPFLADTLYEPLGKPQKGEWLAEFHERPQTVDDYRGSGYNRTDGARQVLYLLPLGAFPDDGRTPSMEALRDYLAEFFAMGARLAPAALMSAPAPRSRINESTGKEQVLTRDILRWLPAQLPADAYCLLAVTMSDLYPDEAWNFVFGEATLSERVGVFSLARNDPAFFGERDGIREDIQRAMILRQACVTLSHETGHMFGWHHCCHYRCLMGGSNNEDEALRAPTALCPVCLHKLYLAHPFEPATRQQRLVDFFTRWQMTSDANAARRVLKAATP